MGDTIWLLPEGVEEDDRDHSLILREKKSLDNLAKTLGRTSLDELLDFSVYAEEYGGGVEPKYLDAGEVHRAVSAWAEAIRADGPATNIDRADEVLEELDDICEKLQQAQDAGKRVRLSVVP